MIELTASSPDTTPVGRLRDDCARARFACDAVGFALGLPDCLLQPSRGSADAAFARQMAMYLCHVGFGISISRVALAFGRDRSTVAHACHLVEDRRDDPAFDQLLCALEQAVRGAPAPGAARLVDTSCQRGPGRARSPGGTGRPPRRRGPTAPVCSRAA